MKTGNTTHASPLARREAEGCSGSKDEPVLTTRALVGGLVVGTLLCFSNTWFGLQSGWVTMGSLQVRDAAWLAWGAGVGAELQLRVG